MSSFDDPYDPPGFVRIPVFGGITADHKLKTLWTNDTDQLTPLNWTEDLTKIVVKSYNYIFGLGVYFAYWLVNPNGSEPQQITETLVDSGTEGEAFDSGENRISIWATSDRTIHLFTSRKR